MDMSDITNMGRALKKNYSHFGIEGKQQFNRASVAKSLTASTKEVPSQASQFGLSVEPIPVAAQKRGSTLMTSTRTRAESGKSRAFVRNVVN
jgi:hypothetical protein